MTGGPSGYDDLQAFFLMRLVRLIKLRDSYGGRLPERDMRAKLINAAFSSTLHDCEALGVAAEANALLESD